MANGNGKKLGDGLSGRSALIVAVISAIFGSISGPMLLVRFGGETVVAPDRFTGEEAALLTARVRHLEKHLVNHPDQANQFDRRITTLEVQYAIILDNQSRILDRLDKL